MATSQVRHKKRKVNNMAKAPSKKQNFGSGYSESDDPKPKAKVGMKKDAPSKVVAPKAKGKK